MSGVPDYTLEATLDFKFTTRQFSTGAPFAFAAGAIEIYEDNSLAQITGAETLTLEFDGVTGLHNLRVAATAANGFENGKSYQCVVSAGTVDSVSVVGEVVQQFSIGRSAAAEDLANATDGLGAIKAVLPVALVGGRMDSSVGAMAANVVTAAAIAAAALNGKGDWNIGKTGYSLTQAFPANFADLSISVTTGRVDVGSWLGAVVNALIAGRVDASVGNMAANVITAAAINAAAITAAKFGASAIDANALAADAALEIADALLNRDMSLVSDTNSRSPLNALRILRNKFSIAASTLTVTKEDDLATAWTSALTTDATADPITASDPA